MYLVVLSGAGTPLFSATYGGPKSDQAYCVQRIKNPNQQPGYVLVGDTRSFNFFPGSCIYVVRTNLAGGSIDQVVIGTSGDDNGYWIEETRDGGFLIAGGTSQRCPLDTVPNQNIFVIRLDPALNVIWNRIISGPGSMKDIAYCVRENPVDNSVIVTGTTESFGNGPESFLLNLTPTGGFNWMRVYGRARVESGENVLVTRDPNNQPQYIVSGSSNSFNSTGNTDAMLYKTDLFGNLLWTRIYGGPQNDNGYEIDQVSTATGAGVNYIQTGSTFSFTNGTGDILLNETNNFGQSGSPCEIAPQQQQKIVTPCITQSAQFVHVNPWLNVQSAYKQLIYKEVKCVHPSPFVSATMTPAPAITEPSLPSTITIGPNPTTAVVTLSTDPSFAGSKLSVIDGNGTVVYAATLSGSNDSMDLNNLPPGLYVARILKPDGTLVTNRVVKK